MKPIELWTVLLAAYRTYFRGAGHNSVFVG